MAPSARDEGQPAWDRYSEPCTSDDWKILRYRSPGAKKGNKLQQCNRILSHAARSAASGGLCRTESGTEEQLRKKKTGEIERDEFGVGRGLACAALLSLACLGESAQFPCPWGTASRCFVASRHNGLRTSFALLMFYSLPAASTHGTYP